MTFTTIWKRNWKTSALGGMLTVFCGLILWKTPPGDSWVNASYDFLFRFGSHAVTNNVVLILMDTEAYNHFHQTRDKAWDRNLHAELLSRLAKDGCALVAFDSFFRAAGDPIADRALADAMKRQRNVVLMAEQDQITDPLVTGAEPVPPCEYLLSAAQTNWGVAWLRPDLDGIVRQHWPFPSPGLYPSLPWTAARLLGASLDHQPEERWLRYYGRDGSWTHISYEFALNQPPGYYRDKVVFIGTQPAISIPNDEIDDNHQKDSFRTPYTRWTGESTGGAEILITEFLNLADGDWLRRPADWLEEIIVVVTGLALGGGLCRLRVIAGIATGAAFAVAFAVFAISLSYATNYWVPWLVISGGQIPCALGWAVAVKLRHTLKARSMAAAPSQPAAADAPVPVAPGYELFNPPFGEGAYGKVWLARNSRGQWRALKAVYLANFGEDAGPYEREFSGIKKYQPVSDKHPGLLRVDFVSEKQDGYFYYIMELGDPLKPDWESDPSTYHPRDLVSERATHQGRRLPIAECLRIGIALSNALDFLHQQGLTHRDIKPQNVIFVRGQPKLADMGLITEIRPLDQVRTFVGTPGYMPPPPERPGTRGADIYALGMVLYVLSTGRNAAFFPEIATTLVDSGHPADFFPLNNVILKACAPDPEERYRSAGELSAALQQTARKIAG